MIPAEPDETFMVTLSGVNGATFIDETATGTIANDDGTTISIAPVSQAEGDTDNANDLYRVHNATSNVCFIGRVGNDNRSGC